jgi:hypothetical protein
MIQTKSINIITGKSRSKKKQDELPREMIKNNIRVGYSNKLLPNSPLAIYKDGKVNIHTVQDWIKMDPIFIYHALYNKNGIKVTENKSMRLRLCINAHKLLIKELQEKHPEQYILHNHMKSYKKSEYNRNNLLKVITKPKYARDINGVKRDISKLKPLSSVITK